MSTPSQTDAIPIGARLLLNLIASVEAGPADQYNVVYGHHEKSLPKPITLMTLSELLANQAKWGKAWGSSAAGAYQIMPTTLQGLIDTLHIPSSSLFTPALQDDLGYNLLLRRGYSGYVAKALSTVAFGKSLAQEWASFPVLTDTIGAHGPIRHGQSYYAGDSLNKALLTPAHVEAVLAEVLVAHVSVAQSIPPKPAATGFLAALRSFFSRF